MPEPARSYLHAQAATFFRFVAALHIVMPRKASVNHRAQNRQQSQRIAEEPMPTIPSVKPTEADSVSKRSGMSFFPQWTSTHRRATTTAADDEFLRKLRAGARETERTLGPALKAKYGDRIPPEAPLDPAAAGRVAAALGGTVVKPRDPTKI